MRFAICALIFLFVLGCTPEGVEVQNVTVEEIMIEEPVVDVPDPVDVEEPVEEKVHVKPAEYADLPGEVDPTVTGGIELNVFDINTTYETIIRFSFEAYNGLGEDVLDPVLRLSINDIVLKQFRFGLLSAGDVLVRLDFPTKARIGEGEKIVEFGIGYYEENVFQEFGSVKKKVIAT